MATLVPAKANIAKAVDVLNHRGIVAFPTETFYGLAADAHDAEAIQTLRTLKKRDVKHPFPVLVPDPGYLKRHTTDLPRQALALAQKHWPGPLTLVLGARDLPKELGNDSGEVGFRMSRHPVAKELTQTFGRCLTCTSANPSGNMPRIRAQEVLNDFEKDEILVLDAGPCPGGRPSTVIRFTAQGSPELIREGCIPFSSLTTHD